MRWMKDLRVPVIEGYKPYYNNATNQIIGYTLKYTNITFASVKNAGCVAVGAERSRVNPNPSF